MHVAKCFPCFLQLVVDSNISSNSTCAFAPSNPADHCPKKSNGLGKGKTEELQVHDNPAAALQDWIEICAAENGRTTEEVWKELEEEYHSYRDQVKKSEAYAAEDEAAEKEAFFASMAVEMPESPQESWVGLKTVWNKSSGNSSDFSA